MRGLVNYVIQSPDKHYHKSEIIEIDEPPYTYNDGPPVHAALEWKEDKSKQVEPNQEIVIVSIYKV